MSTQSAEQHGGGLRPGLRSLRCYLILENRLYLPAIGAVTLAAVAMTALAPSIRIQAAISGVVFLIFVARASLYLPCFSSPHAFTKAGVEQSPNSPLAVLNYGIDRHTSNDHREAEKLYKRALRLNPREPIVNYNLGVLAMDAKDWNKAQAYFLEELRLNPKYTQSLFSLAKTQRALGHPAGAVQALEQVLRYESDNINALGELMVLEESLGHAERAAALRQRLVEVGFVFPPPGSQSSAGAQPPSADPMERLPAGAVLIPSGKLPPGAHMATPEEIERMLKAQEHCGP